MTSLPDNLSFEFGLAQLGFRAKREDCCCDDFTAIFVISPKFNVGALGVGIVLSVYESKQHRQPLRSEEVYHTKKPWRE
jgi:hypothetical protein